MGFSDRAPCGNLHKGEQKDKTWKTLAEFPDHISIDYGGTNTESEYEILQSLFHILIFLDMPIRTGNRAKYNLPMWPRQHLTTFCI